MSKHLNYFDEETSEAKVSQRIIPQQIVHLAPEHLWCIQFNSCKHAKMNKFQTDEIYKETHQSNHYSPILMNLARARRNCEVPTTSNNIYKNVPSTINTLRQRNNVSICYKQKQKCNINQTEECEPPEKISTTGKITLNLPKFSIPTEQSHKMNPFRKTKSTHPYLPRHGKVSDLKSRGQSSKENLQEILISRDRKRNGTTKTSQLVGQPDRATSRTEFEKLKSTHIDKFQAKELCPNPSCKEMQTDYSEEFDGNIRY